MGRNKDDPELGPEITFRDGTGLTFFKTDLNYPEPIHKDPKMVHWARIKKKF